MTANITSTTGNREVAPPATMPEPSDRTRQGTTMVALEALNRSPTIEQVEAPIRARKGFFKRGRAKIAALLIGKKQARGAAAPSQQAPIVTAAAAALLRPAGEVAYRSRRGSLHHYTPISKINEGSFKAVWSVNRFSLNCAAFALSLVKAGQSERSERAAILSNAALREVVHAAAPFRDGDGNAIGIQLPCHDVVYLQRHGDDSDLPHGTIEPHYRGGDLLEVLLSKNRPDGAEALPIALQMAYGLANLHHCGFYHGDIKPDNVLLHGQRADLIDIGGRPVAHSKADLQALGAPLEGIRTASYVTAKDYGALGDAVRDGQVERYNLLMEKMDVLALAGSIFATFVGGLPYGYDARGLVNLSTLNLAPLRQVKGLTAQQQESLIALLKQAFNANAALRPSALQLATELAKLAPNPLYSPSVAGGNTNGGHTAPAAAR